MPQEVPAGYPRQSETGRGLPFPGPHEHRRGVRGVLSGEGVQRNRKAGGAGVGPVRPPPPGPRAPWAARERPLQGVLASSCAGVGRVTALDCVPVRVSPGELAAAVCTSVSGKSGLLAVTATLAEGGDRIPTAQPVGSPDSRRAVAGRRAHARPFSTPGGRHRPGDLGRGRASCKEHRRSHQLSGSEHQRVNIARALVGRPSVLLVGGPTAALEHEPGPVNPPSP